MFQTASNDIVKRTITTVVLMVGACTAFVGTVSIALVVLIGQVKGGTSSDTTTDTAAASDGAGDSTTPGAPAKNAVKAPRTAQVKPAQRI
ncbi:MAG TPA: hypothetical protein VF407_15800 [Polyangiaceae bacterium]